MAKRLNTVNFVYTAIGLAVAGGIGYYVYTRLRNRRIGQDFGGQTGGTQGITQGSGFGQADTQDNLMELRRSTRKAGRAVKDAATGVGKSVKRGATDVGEAFEDASSSGKALIEQESSGYKSTY
jgi:hypothetical protein